MSVRIHQPLFSNPTPAFITQLDNKAVGWRQNRAKTGGDLEAEFTLTGEIEQLTPLFLNWLGCHIESKQNGGVWQGYINEAVLHHRGVSRTIGLNTVYNATRSRFTTSYDSNLVLNGSFETNAGGGTPTFTDWLEAGSAVVTQESGAYEGDYCARVSKNYGSSDYLYQQITLSEAGRYAFSFWAHGEGASDPRYGIWDLDNSVDLIPITAVGATGLSWVSVSETFEIPAGINIEIRLWSGTPIPGYVFYDDVRLQKELEAEEQLTDWFTNPQSIRLYGRRELEVDAKENPLAQAEEMARAELLQRAFPQISSPRINEGANVTKLEVRCVGYWATAFFQYLTVDTGGSLVKKSDLVRQIIAADMPWLKVGIVRENAEKRRLKADGRVRAGQALADIAGEGSISAAWRLVVENGRYLAYEPIEQTPTYYRRDENYYGSLAGQHPVSGFALKPGVVVRDANFPRLNTVSQGVTQSITDFVVKEWEVSVDGRVRAIS